MRPPATALASTAPASTALAFALTLALTLAVAGGAAAQHAGHSAATDHGAMNPAGMAPPPAPDAPTEPGQSAFAAIAEIVAMLDADPETDWSRVDIGALRAHLRDMDLVTLRSEAAMTQIETGARFEIAGADDVADAIRRMTLAHAPFLEAEADWRVTAEATPRGAILTVAAADPALTAKIRALGFYGLMTLGAHHPAHHLAMARGDGAAVHGQDDGRGHAHGHDQGPGPGPGHGQGQDARKP